MEQNLAVTHIIEVPDREQSNTVRCSTCKFHHRVKPYQEWICASLDSAYKLQYTPHSHVCDRWIQKK